MIYSHYKGAACLHNLDLDNGVELCLWCRLERANCLPCSNLLDISHRFPYSCILELTRSNVGGARTYQRRWVGHSDLKLSRELVMPRTLILERDSICGGALYAITRSSIRLRVYQSTRSQAVARIADRTAKNCRVT